MVESLDSLKLAQALDRHAREQGRTLGVLLQVNVGGEERKSGCAPEEAPALAQAVAGMAGLRLRGLMTMPPWFEEPEKARPFFARLRSLAENLGRDLPPGAMEELSMGTSDDFPQAIAEGATLVRVGTSLFGARDYSR